MKSKLGKYAFNGLATEVFLLSQRWKTTAGAVRRMRVVDRERPLVSSYSTPFYFSGFCFIGVAVIYDTDNRGFW